VRTVQGVSTVTGSWTGTRQAIGGEPATNSTRRPGRAPNTVVIDVATHQWVEEDYGK